MSIRQGGKVIAGNVIAGNTSGRNVGDIFYTMRTDNKLNGAVECDGATYNISDFSGSGSIGALLLAGKIPYISMAEYETITAGNNDGSCGYIGWDGGSADTFRVPCLNYVFLEATKSSENKQANYRAAGLPDHNHTVSTYHSAYAYAGGSYGGLTGSTNRTTSNASASNPIYGNSTTVQPKSVRYRAMIQLAVATTDEALETCTSVLADVAGLKTNKIEYCAFDTSTRVPITATAQTATKNGWLIGSLWFSGSNVYFAIDVDGIEIIHSPWATNNAWGALNASIPLKAGQTYRYFGNGTVERNDLYFYPNNE